MNRIQESFLRDCSTEIGFEDPLHRALLTFYNSVQRMIDSLQPRRLNKVLQHIPLKCWTLYQRLTNKGEPSINLVDLAEEIYAELDKALVVMKGRARSEDKRTWLENDREALANRIGVIRFLAEKQSPLTSLTQKHFWEFVLSTPRLDSADNIETADYLAPVYLARNAVFLKAGEESVREYLKAYEDLRSSSRYRETIVDPNHKSYEKVQKNLEELTSSLEAQLLLEALG